MAVQCRSTANDNGATAGRYIVLLIAGCAVRDMVEIDGSVDLRNARPHIIDVVVSNRKRRYKVIYLIDVTAKAASCSEMHG